jgi:hypothetical protein
VVTTADDDRGKGGKGKGGDDHDDESGGAGRGGHGDDERDPDG